MVALDRLGDVLQHHRLADARRRHDQAPLALAERRHDVDDPARAVPQRGILDLHVQALFGIERSQIVEQDLGLDRLGVLEIDRVDLEQGEIALALTRAAHRAVHRIARPQPEAADLRRRNVDVIRAGQIVGVRAAQEAETVRQNLQDAVGDDFDLLLGQGLEDGEQQVLLAQVGGVLDLKPFGEGDQIRGRLLVQLGQGDAAVGNDRLAVFLVGFLINHAFVAGRLAVLNLVALEGFGFGRGDVGVAHVGHGGAHGRTRAGEPARALLYPDCRPGP